MIVVMLGAALLGLAAAQNAFLDELERHPELEAARLQLEAYRLGERLAPNWIALDASGGIGRRELGDAGPCPFLNDPDPTNDVLCNLVNPDLPDETNQAQVGLTLRPIPFGDFSDQVKFRSLERQQAELDYRLARSRLQAAALRAALDVAEARRGLDLAREGQRLAEKALAVTELQVHKGAAKERSLQEAKQALREARERVRQAEEGLSLAEAALASFASVPPPPPPWFRSPLPRSEPPEVTRARLRVEQANVAVTHASRDFWPTAQASYSYSLDEHNAVGVSLETRTLGVRAYYDHASYADPARARTDTELRLGISLNVSIDTWANYDAARLRLRAARAALAAAEKRAALELKRRRQALEQSVREVELANTKLELALTKERDIERRVGLGLAVPLELLGTQIERLQTELELVQARNRVLKAQLDYLVFIGVPPSEVWR